MIHPNGHGISKDSKARRAKRRAKPKDEKDSIDQWFDQRRPEPRVDV